MRLHPRLTFNELRNNNVVTAWHASESPDFIPLNTKPLHVGSVHQARSLVQNMTKHNPSLMFYMYELQVSVKGLSPILYDEDPIGIDSYPVIAYRNRIEFPQGMRIGDNISLVLNQADDLIICYCPASWAA